MEKLTVIEKTYKVLGFTEEIQTCDCCGREGLKGTLVLENLETGDINYFGSICGVKIAGNTKKFIEEQLTQVEKENISAASIEFRNSPEKIAYDKWMIDREVLYTGINQSYEEVQEIWLKTNTISASMKEVKNKIAKKHYIKYTYKII